MLPNLLPGQDVPLAVENHGSHILTGGSVTVYDSGVWIQMTHRSILQSVKNRRYIGTLYAGERLVLDLQIQPEQFIRLGGDKSGFRVFIYVAAQNFTATEYLDFKHDSSHPWVYRYKIYRDNNPAEFVRARKKGKTPQSPVFLEAMGWSLDANDPVRATEKEASDWH
jgi:hypothetical protein